MREYKSFYKTVGGGEGTRCKYPTRLDTYECGCAHDCAYCYAKSLLDFRDMWNPEYPSVASIDKIRRKLRRVPNGTIVRLGGMTDCFQPIERELGVTKHTIECMNELGIGYLIVTKSDLVGEYADIMDRSLAHIQMSVTSTSDGQNVLREKAPSPTKRLRCARLLQDEGFDVQVRLSPYIPELVDIDAIARYGIRKGLVEFPRVNGFIRKWLEGYDLSAYTLKHGGCNHMELDDKIAHVERISQAFDEITVCEDVDEHMAYWVEHVNANRNDCCNLAL